MIVDTVASSLPWWIVPLVVTVVAATAARLTWRFTAHAALTFFAWMIPWWAVSLIGWVRPSTELIAVGIGLAWACLPWCQRRWVKSVEVKHEQ